MSIEELNRFLQMVATNEELAEKMKEIGENDDAIVAYGKELGYDFDRQDIEELRKKVIDLHKVRIKRIWKKPSLQQIRSSDRVCGTCIDLCN